MKGYRTILVNALTLIAAIGAALADANLPVDWTPWLVAGVAVVNVILRFITTTPVGEK